MAVYSGSRAEGLRFESSDDDWMFIYRIIKVIQSDSYTAIYDSNMTLLLMENEMTKPGFALLKLIGESTHRAVRQSTENILNGRYVSCKRWRELHTKHSEFTHGPCVSFAIGSLEYDLAYCLRCDIWPADAQDCIRRLHQSSWPSHNIILSIVNDGVLFVPIGSKQSIFENTEWRMSFSLAEKKLIYAMNHTQFLCYGLLKIFLKEAIDTNPEVKGLLCSYFMKTALFWEITTTSNQWNPSTLLFCFWNCFRRLLRWVSCSYCPNFFIPQNNMFGGKIEGRNRYKLLQHLRILYLEGYKCLIRCQSLANRFILAKVRKNINTELREVDNAVIAIEIINEFLSGKHDIPLENLWMTYQLASPTSSHERFLLKNWLHCYMTKYSLSSTSYSSAKDGDNKSNYRNLTQRMNIMGRCRTDSVAYLLYQAMLCYNKGSYNRTLRLVQQSKDKISDPSSFYWHNISVEQFRGARLDRLPIETMMRRNYLDYISIANDQYIPELVLESPIIEKLSFKLIPRIPPLVFAIFLQYLCHRKLIHLREADDALYELSLLVQHDDGHHIGIVFKAISWQILGICRQINGDDRAACRSFMTAQQQLTKDFIKYAASVRLGIMLLKYF